MCECGKRCKLVGGFTRRGAVIYWQSPAWACAEPEPVEPRHWCESDAAAVAELQDLLDQRGPIGIGFA